MSQYNDCIEILKNSLLRASEERDSFWELDNIIITWQQMMFTFDFTWEEIESVYNQIYNSTTNEKIRGAIEEIINQ